MAERSAVKAKCAKGIDGMLTAGAQFVKRAAAKRAAGGASPVIGDARSGRTVAAARGTCASGVALTAAPPDPPSLPSPP